MKRKERVSCRKSGLTRSTRWYEKPYVFDPFPPPSERFATAPPQPAPSQHPRLSFPLLSFLPPLSPSPPRGPRPPTIFTARHTSSDLLNRSPGRCLTSSLPFPLHRYQFDAALEERYMSGRRSLKVRRECESMPEAEAEAPFSKL